MGEEINWDSLDKQKFAIWGAGLFSVRSFLHPYCAICTFV